MSKKVIDVSSYQGKIDWAKVKAAGVEGAILKIIRKDLNPDKQFENNWKGCEAVGMPILGVYNYSYATSVSKARTDARRVIAVLNGRRAKVWLDVEDSVQKGLGVKLIDIINEYKKEIENAGLEFGVYTGLSFYNSYIKAWYHMINANFWMARYPSSARVGVDYMPDPKKQPVIKHTMEGWQFSSKGSVPGISGNVDMNVWYGDIMAPGKPEGNPYPIPERLLRLKTIRMTGNDVRWLQHHLVRLGFLSEFNSKGKSNIDGVFGPSTDKAVMAAQAHYGIDADGIVGAMTRYVLQFN